MVFIVDDDYAIRDCLGLVIETAGFAYKSFESAECFLQVYFQSTLDCLLLDVEMPGMNGLDLQDELIRRNLHLPIIFISANADLPTKARAIEAGAFDFLTKPISSQLLIERIQTALQHTE